MKKVLFLLLVCAALGACSSDDLVITSTSSGTGDGIAYLTVRIKDVNSGTRGSSNGFAYGTEKEQFIRNAYFYLYDDNGNYYAYGSLEPGKSGMAGTAADTTGDTAGNIEWNSETQVVIWGLTDPSKPTKMVTVLNQPSDFTGVNKSFSEMTAALASRPYSNGNGDFIMTTSTYSNSGIVNYTALTADDFATEPIDIANDYANGGVDIYVERLAAKVGVDVAEDLEGDINLTSTMSAQFPKGAPDGGVYVDLLGFGVNGVARDAYVLKNIDDNSNWSNLSFVWNDADDYRCYWGESPNYGDKETIYPTSSLGNGDIDEEEVESSSGRKAGLNEYLRYTSLDDSGYRVGNDLYGQPRVNDFGSAIYCGENTNTVGDNGVIADATSNALTNILVKAQVMTKDDDELVPLDLVEYHGGYYTAEDFCNTVVDEVVDYDFTIVVDEVIDALKNSDTFSTVASYLDDLKAAIITDYIYCTPAVDNHIITSTNAPDINMNHYFRGDMLSLYNAYDGNVKVFYNGAQPYWGTPDEGFTAVGTDIISKYPSSDIVYGGENLDDYEFWFHIDSAELGTLERFGLTELGILYQIPRGSGDYFMAIDNNISFNTVATGDDAYSGGHTYTLRNFFLRTITVEADGIDSKFGSIYPNYFKDGLMYYHVPIEHLGTTTGDNIVEGQYGVVRNHWYDANITYIQSLGRGIADETEVIVPQKDIDLYYLGADINILSWKMVGQDVGW